MPTSTKDNTNSKKHNDVAVILEHIELLVELHEEQNGTDVASEQENLHRKQASGFRELESLISLKFKTLESKIDSLSKSFNDQSKVLETSGVYDLKSADWLFQEDKKQELETNLASVTNQITEKTEFIIGSFETRFENVIQDMGEKFSELIQQSDQANHESTDKDEDEDEDETSHWEKQKEAMLSKYGVESDHGDAGKTPPSASAKPLNQTTPREKPAVESPPQQPLDTHDIDALKSELNEKLREAEIELSIGRAKISQQQAEIASRHVDLERRNEALESKLAACPAGPSRKMGFLDRLTRHLRRD
ncbi:MAG: hypothetical protein OSA89_19470 [Mariniblastus sp.]|nr:hypothetical protein [Mariniblastus sp.]